MLERGSLAPEPIGAGSKISLVFSGSYNCLVGLQGGCKEDKVCEAYEPIAVEVKASICVAKGADKEQKIAKSKVAVAIEIGAFFRRCV